jgi:hypothetical protein
MEGGRGRTTNHGPGTKRAGRERGPEGARPGGVPGGGGGQRSRFGPARCGNNRGRGQGRIVRSRLPVGWTLLASWTLRFRTEPSGKAWMKAKTVELTVCIVNDSTPDPLGQEWIGLHFSQSNVHCLKVLWLELRPGTRDAVRFSIVRVVSSQQ